MPFSWRASDRLGLLTELRIRAERAGVGDPARVIVLHANSRKADLVVLDPTGDGAGADSGRALSENASCAAPRGQC